MNRTDFFFLNQFKKKVLIHLIGCNTLRHTVDSKRIVDHLIRTARVPRPRMTMIRFDASGAPTSPTRWRL